MLKDKELLLTMSPKELLKLEIIQKVSEKRLTQKEASIVLGLNLRHVKRLCTQFKLLGAEGLVSKRRGKPSNRRLSEDLKKLAISLIVEHYWDFGPTFANEKLRELHNVYVSTPTLRKWMVESQTWITRAQKVSRPYQPRYRRSCFGGLVQIDGSEHAWFEDRAPKCTLLVYVDDATSKILEMRFVPEESTFTYFEATKSYIRKYGKPVSFYSDKYSVFRVNHKNAKSGDGITQFGRALIDLNIDIINAHSSQAKGRVERANKTLQDRLIKEMRLRGISNMAQGNSYLPFFIEDYNHKFGKEPLSKHDAHRTLLDWQEERVLTKNLTLNYDKRLYMLNDSPDVRVLKRKRVKVYDYADGKIRIVYGNKELSYRVFDKLQRVSDQAIVENKRLGAVLAFVKQQQDLRDEQRSKSCPKKYPLEYLAS